MQLTSTEQSILMQQLMDKLVENITIRGSIKNRNVANIQRDIDIVLGRAIHGMKYRELADEHGISSNRVMQIYAKNIQYLTYTLRHLGVNEYFFST